MHMTRQLAAVLCGLTMSIGSALAQSAPPETMRAEVGKPLQAAQDLLRAGKPREALSRVAEAEAVGNLSGHERMVIERMRAGAALGAGDDATAARSFEAVLASGKLGAAETLPVLESMAGLAYRRKDYPQAIALAERYLKEGGRSDKMRELASRQAAEDEKALQVEVVGRQGDALVNTGHALVSAGRLDKGIALLEHGLTKGGLKRPDEARLHLGQAYLQSGNKARAIDSFRAVRGADEAVELARLWEIHARKP